MLFNEIEKVIKKINALNADKEVKVLAGMILRARADAFEKVDKKIRDKLTIAFAAAWLKQIKNIPALVNTLRSVIDDPNTPPTIRCALLGTLVYLVQPNDLIPDEAPGGYGFVDDVLILRVAMIEYLNLLPPNPSEQEKERKYVEIISSLIPLSDVPKFQLIVGGLSTTFQMLSHLPDFLVEMTCQQLIQNPFQTSLPSAAPGFTPSPYQLPTSNPNVTVEGRSVNVNFPGGGGAFMDQSGNILGWE